MKNNFVAKYAKRVNRAAVHTDKKKEAKKGDRKRKHKEKYL